MMERPLNDTAGKVRRLLFPVRLSEPGAMDGCRFFAFASLVVI